MWPWPHVALDRLPSSWIFVACFFDADLICSPSCLRSGRRGVEAVALRTASWKRQNRKKKKNESSSSRPRPAALLAVELRSRKRANPGSGQIVACRKLLLDI